MFRQPKDRYREGREEERIKSIGITQTFERLAVVCDVLSEFTPVNLTSTQVGTRLAYRLTIVGRSYQTLRSAQLDLKIRFLAIYT